MRGRGRRVAPLDDGHEIRGFLLGEPLQGVPDVLGHYRFDPATGNSATVSLPSTTHLRHLRLTVTANTGWPAGQFSEVEAYLS
ncbi:hypothetical protein GR925_20640 [Streptomyces sp. HUCO-GS316]|uniref:hypothetical protein n=1 Tax=Streptomyces sp. HUCO-GS316 TaxID=2692198 RepID=UPI0013FFF1F6|nr:hypothetical protein [Streptomyces sp. HUCO-GS316]MXM65792.1 hypothetical protein [Streptomyces sp. HUCO-GS316]